MYYEGFAKLDKRTKNLVKRLKSKDIAIIDHADLDRITAESLIEAKVEVVINASSFTSGRYPNIGPLLLCSAGVHLIDNVGEEIFKQIKEGQKLVIRGEEIFSGKKLVAKGEVLNLLTIQQKMEQAKKSLGAELEKFVSNTLYYIKKEKDILVESSNLPQTSVGFKDRHALVVVRGYDYKEDLKILRSYIREIKPVLIGVDGGADALLAEGYDPDIIIGDMDSVTDQALGCGAEVIVHGYPNGKVPGLSRLEELGLTPLVFKSAGTSEDIALLLAYEKGAELIVAVGTHANLVEFLDKGRKGMASTFLVRLKVGERLVDAKGVNKLYRAKVKVSHLAFLLLAAVATVAIVVLVSTTVRQFLRLVVLNLRSIIGL